MLVSITCGVIKNSTTHIKGMASVMLDNLVVINGIKIIQSKKGDYFVGMPSQKSSKGIFSDVAYLKDSTKREQLDKAILETFFNKSTIVNNYEI